MKSIMSLFFVLVLFSCGDDDCDPSQDCPSNLICTEEYRTITVDIEDTDGGAVALDRFVITNLETNEPVEQTRLDIFPEGTYPIAEDNLLEVVTIDGTQFRFEGFINDEKVVEQIFVIGHDCCHVILVDGPSTIVVDL